MVHSKKTDTGTPAGFRKERTQQEKAFFALQNALSDLRLASGITLTVDIDQDSPSACIEAAEKIRSITGAYREKYDKKHFLFSLMTDPSAVSFDVQKKANSLHIDPCRKRVLLLIKMKLADEDTMQILSQLIPHPRSSYTLLMDDRHAAVILPDDFKSEEEKAETIASIVDTLNAEALQSVHIAVSSPFFDLIALPAVYKETALTLQAGSLFYSQKNVFFCGRLGVARLIYNLPEKLCLDFLAEIFPAVPKQLDAGTLDMMNCFFRNSLHVAETARQLHMHRNTLVYRLEQLEKQTGLELRSFDGAMTFKIAMMLISYLNDRKDL